MKNIIIFIVFILALVLVQFANGQSVDDIIDQYITARGGKDKLTSIKSLYMEGTRQMMGNEVDVKVTKVDGKLSRVDFAFGSNTGYTIITPEKGWSYIPMRSDKAEEMPQERLKTMQDQMDIAGPLVNYAFKGYKASLQGKDTANGKEAWKILLTNSLGKEETFYIDTTTHLLIQTKQMTEGGGRRNSGPTEVITDFSDYKDVDGVMFPQTLTTEGTGMGSGAMIFDKIEINKPVDESLYKPSN
ncbi:outer membrane lipoprotein-sorting protein [Ginsengibacter hankyongi]|uniref:Outer membrane lipoprotein-sorting protein n=1 Tax=Ginsengibacter hankyongi TaxID=2607284 RepID=A0A5J5IGF1_9BACT|nr:outer membrane lipoprotein-sorting protein [Ginsengibacter hankyongi]KAA9039235.1 outer membrane lipoprotein-sorting protein [Ginsengibacter hankyongi]